MFRVATEEMNTIAPLRRLSWKPGISMAVRSWGPRAWNVHHSRASSAGSVSFDGHPSARDTGVVDDDRGVAEFGPNRFYHRTALVVIADRGLEGRGASAELADCGDSVIGRLAVTPVVDRDVGAVFGESQGDGASDASAASGHEGQAG